MSTNANPSTNGTTAPSAAAHAHDLGAALDDSVRKGVAALVAVRAKEIAKDVVEQALTPEVIEGMRRTALEEVAATTAPAEPEPEEAEEERPLMYATVEEFVAGWVAHTYRREVTARGAEGKLRWCPKWHEHGEAVARLSAIWHAFEHLRWGTTTEQAVFWVQFVDPIMMALFDIEGPFKYCSPKAHSTEMLALPLIEAPAGTFQNGNYEERPSGLLVPSHLKIEFPG